MVAYQYAGVTVPTKDEWPPRRITVITRIGTRNVVNIDEGVELIRSYGLEVNWITEMGLLTFNEQVAAMANTGILLAVHGAGLANVLFMPAHSVVVEVRSAQRRAPPYIPLSLDPPVFFFYFSPADHPLHYVRINVPRPRCHRRAVLLSPSLGQARQRVRVHVLR